MQPSYPANISKKLRWKREGKRAIKAATREADIIVISHYHHDHYFPNDMGIYKNKLLLAKNPNEYINDSQRRRAEKFYTKIYRRFGKLKLDDVLKEPKIKRYPHPLHDLPIAKHKNFGDYNKRRKQLMKRGYEWFSRRVHKWNEYPEIAELEFKEITVHFPEGKEYSFGRTTLRFTKPLFHGIEFSRVGWIFATVIEYRGEKLIHTSDMNGPIIEDYAAWLIKENPDVLILDGPMTYMRGYLLNFINLNRAIENAISIIKKTEAKLIIYDHHLPRETKFKENTEKVWKAAKKFKKKLLTVADFLGGEPRVLVK